ncbi:MAG: hypothetical protein KAQ64_00115 [Candidatus Pacebacteria bacterium]|nr:hypothetical protein [Candidatus Paceibacterota bacterium]
MTDYIIVVNIFTIDSNDNRLFKESSEHIIKHCADPKLLEALEDLKKTAIDNFCNRDKKYKKTCCTSSIHQIIRIQNNSTTIF